MMSETEKREEILDLLARGKISIDEAVEMLDHSSGQTNSLLSDEPLFRAEMEQDFDAVEEVKIKIDDDLSTEKIPTIGEDIQSNDMMQSEIKTNGNSKQPRWLRVQVVNSKTGNNKVTVNVPFAMVKFGLGIAQVFSPEIKGVDLNEINELFSNADAGILVDVQDEDSNEHVKIFFD
jgi:predicted HTH domain antitoxin